MRKSALPVLMFLLPALIAVTVCSRDDLQLQQGQQASKKGKLFGGRFMFLMEDEEVVTGVIYSIAGEGPEREIILTDGRRLQFGGLSMINCRDMETSFPQDEDKIRDGQQTLILDDGSAIYGQIVDFSTGKSFESRFFELADGRSVSWQKVLRIHFR
jgi:hypothetical protein